MVVVVVVVMMMMVQNLHSVIYVLYLFVAAYHNAL
jgi:hypothetical protein